MKLFFVTSNKQKFLEAKKIINNIFWKKMHLPEIQSDSLEEIALFSVKYAYKKLHKPCFVEDSGIFIKALKGFPGVYSHYALDTIGLDGILKMLKGINERRAEYIAVIAFTNGRRTKIFRGVVRGRISKTKKGKHGFGHDPIFIPDGREKTFAEDIGYKHKVSHRVRALKKLARWIRAKLYK